VARPQLGNKRECPNCGTKFYDLNRDRAACPKCGHMVAAEVVNPRARLARQAKAAPTPVPEPPKVVVDVVPPVNVVDGDDDIVVDSDTEVSLEEIEEGDDVDDEDDDAAFLEPDEEGGDVTDLIGGPPGEEV
jgi:uncharacterized protein (TIGR02300 family)